MNIDEKAEFKVMQDQLKTVNANINQIKTAIIGDPTFGQEGLVSKVNYHEKKITDLEDSIDKRVTALEKKFDRVFWIAMGAFVPFSMGIVQIIQFVKDLIK